MVASEAQYFAIILWILSNLFHFSGSQKEKYKSPSYQIREGDCVNNHVTGPGATLALGMMYFNTGNV